ncbi:hypothetical protein SMMN14_02790 [Sphaerulina musiva]
MDEAQFQLAIEELAQSFQTLKHTAQLKDCDWQDVTLIRSQNLPSSLNHFLRLTRRLPLRSKEKKKPPDTTPQQHQVPEAQEVQSQITNDEQAIEEEEEDPECLPKFPPTTTHPSTDPTTTTITYDIIYSPTYRVPILYIHKPPPPPIPLPDDDNNDDDDDNDNDNPDPFLIHLQNSSSSSSTILLSLIDHPATGKPVYFIHPCRTQEAIAEILSSSSSSSSTRRLGKNGGGGGEEEEETGGREGGMQWFMAWWGCIGNSAGLSVPMELARMVMMPTLTTTKTMSTTGGE